MPNVVTNNWRKQRGVESEHSFFCSMSTMEKGLEKCFTERDLQLGKYSEVAAALACRLQPMVQESEKPELEHEVLDCGRSIMAEPDYIDDEDSAELIRPRKLINPVKTSKNHQDLHRELIINQKRGIAPQNKPELQRVMEQRKRDQVVKQKKEEEAQKKSDLEQELMKRQQRLDQIEQEKLNAEEKQENAPEFVKMKGNLRRTKHEESGDLQVS